MRCLMATPPAVAVRADSIAAPTDAEQVSRCVVSGRAWGRVDQTVSFRMAQDGTFFSKG